MKRGSTVIFKEPKPGKQAPTGRGAQAAEHIPGKWYVIEAAPDGWWLRPSDTPAINWAYAHPDRLVSGCLQAPTRKIEPSFYVHQ